MKTYIILFLITAMINSIMGCGMSTKQIRVDELSGSDGKKIWAVILPETIIGIINTEGDTLSFQNGSGLYQSNTKLISGTFENGEQAAFSVDDVEQVRLKKGTIAGYETRSVKRRNFLAQSRKQLWHILQGMSIREGTTVHFQKPGASYDSTEHFIRGIALDGTLVDIETGRVYRAVYRRFSPDNFASSAILIGVGFLALVALYVKITWEPWGP